MQNDEQVFDFLAAAEDTGRQLDELIKAIPGEVRETLAAEYRKSPWLATLPGTADKVTEAAERAEAATVVLTQKAAFAGLIVCVMAVAVPLLTWGYAYWHTSELRRERDAYKAECEQYKVLAAALKDETGGGVGVWKEDNGKWIVALPFGVKPAWKGEYDDGRYGFTYTWPPTVE